jgi:hypothetical protein
VSFLWSGLKRKRAEEAAAEAAGLHKQPRLGATPATTTSHSKPDATAAQNAASALADEPPASSTHNESGLQVNEVRHGCLLLRCSNLPFATLLVLFLGPVWWQGPMLFT